MGRGTLEPYVVPGYYETPGSKVHAKNKAIRARKTTAVYKPASEDDKNFNL